MAINISAVKMEAMLACYLSAQDEAQLAGARATAEDIADLSDEEVLELIGEGGGEEGVLQMARGEWPIQYVAPKVPEGYTIGGLPGGAFVSSRRLAHFYAGLFTSLAMADSLPPSEIPKANAELKPFGWQLRHDEEGRFWPMEIDTSSQLHPVKVVGQVARFQRERDRDNPISLLEQIHGEKAGERLSELSGVVKLALSHAALDQEVRKYLSRFLVQLTAAMAE